MNNPFPMPLRVVEREKDGSVYIEGGSPDAKHVAFDVACTAEEARFLVTAANDYAKLRASLTDLADCYFKRRSEGMLELMRHADRLLTGSE